MLPLATALDKTGVTAAMATGLTHLLRPWILRHAERAVPDHRRRSPVHLQHRNRGADRAGGNRRRADLGVSTHAFAITVAVACSCAFVTPVSSPINTLVLEPGRYGFNDFVKVGLPLLVLTLIVTVAMVGVLYPIFPPQR